MNIKKWLTENCSGLYGKTIVITGTTGGIGNATLHHFAQLGAKVITGVRNTARAEEQYNEIKKFYPDFELTILKVDLQSVESIKTFANKITKLSPNGIDALINNAGVYAQQKEILESGFEKHFFVNCIAPALLSKLLLPTLSKKQNSKILFVSSISIFFTKINLEDINSLSVKNKTKVYARSKKWLTFYARSLAKKLEDTNVNLSIVHPGITASSLFLPKHKGFRKTFYPVLNFFMKLVFPSVSKASLSEIFALTTKTQPTEWVGPTKFFNIYGKPRTKTLKIKNETKKIEDLCYEQIDKIIINL